MSQKERETDNKISKPQKIRSLSIGGVMAGSLLLSLRGSDTVIHSRRLWNRACFVGQCSGSRLLTSSSLSISSRSSSISSKLSTSQRRIVSMATRLERKGGGESGRRPIAWLARSDSNNIRRWTSSSIPDGTFVSPPKDSPPEFLHLVTNGSEAETGAGKALFSSLELASEPLHFLRCHVAIKTPEGLNFDLDHPLLLAQAHLTREIIDAPPEAHQQENQVWCTSIWVGDGSSKREATYDVLAQGIAAANTLGVKKLQVVVDSINLAYEICGLRGVHVPTLASVYERIRVLIQKVPSFSVLATPDGKGMSMLVYPANEEGEASHEAAAVAKTGGNVILAFTHDLERGGGGGGGGAASKQESMIGAASARGKSQEREGEGPHEETKKGGSDYGMVAFTQDLQRGGAADKEESTTVTASTRKKSRKEPSSAAAAAPNDVGKSSSLSTKESRLRSRLIDRINYGDNATYVLRFDGGSRGNPGPGGAGAVIYRKEEGILKEIYTGCFWLGTMTNNEAEYQGLIKGLEAACRVGIKRVRIEGDSQLIVRQILGEYKVRNDRLKALHTEAMDLIGRLDGFEIKHIEREDNRRADGLANQALDHREDVSLDTPPPP